MRWGAIQSELIFEEELIVALCLEVDKLKIKGIYLVKVFWRCSPVEEGARGAYQGMLTKYPHLYECSGTFCLLTFNNESLFCSGCCNDPPSNFFQYPCITGILSYSIVSSNHV